MPSAALVWAQSTDRARIGHRLHAETGIVIDHRLDVITAHEIANAVHHRLLHEVPKLVGVTVHVSPSPVEGRDFHAVLRNHPHPESVR